MSKAAKAAQISSLKIKVLRGEQGVQMVSFQGHIRPKDLISFIGHDPRSKSWKLLSSNIRKLYEAIQRSTHPARVKSLSEYVGDRIIKKGIAVGALPAISIGLTKPADFTAIDGAYGELSVPNDSETVVFDGLARVSSLLSLIEAGVIDKKMPDLPITIVAPKRDTLGVTGMSQLFYDFNVMRHAVTSKQARGKDSASPYTQVARALLRLEQFQQIGYVGHHVFNEEKMVRFLRASIENMPVTASIARRIPAPELTGANYASYIPKFELFFSRLIEKMGDNFGAADHVLAYQHGYGAIATAIFKYSRGRVTMMSDAEIENMADAVASIDWSRGNPDWEGVMLDKANGVVLGGAGRPRTEDYVVEKIGDFIASSKGL